MSVRIVVTGVAGAVGSRVAKALAADDDIVVVGVDRIGAPSEDLAGHHLGDLRTLDLDEIFEGADTIVHLASAYGRNEFVDASRHDTRAAQLTLDAGARAGVGQIVLLSSAMVYGARTENPIPLTENAEVRPSPLAFAENKATIERLGNEWRSATGAKLTILRPSTAVASGRSSWVAKSMQLAAGLASDSDPPLQFLHLDDLARAVEVLVREGAEGVFNVAPDGWVRAEEVRSLSGRAPRLPIPSAVADQIVRFSWNKGIVATPPGIMQYATEPWVVSNDRLRNLGWEPSWSNVEAYVDSFDPRPWAMLNAKRRQQIALGGAGVGLAAVAAAARLISRRWLG
jgi:nucleoside-diphosphate-sugar epimerase